MLRKFLLSATFILVLMVILIPIQATHVQASNTFNNYLRPTATATPPVLVNSVPNGSVEQPSDSDPTIPQDWITNNWGTNTATFSYLNTGHTGTHSIETTITSYSSGDAKWYYTPQPAQAGVQYKVTDYYEANITSQVVIMITATDGSIQYLSLRNAEPASEWTQYSDTFTTPINTQTVTVFHLIQAVGYLITDDYSVTPYTPVGFKRGMVSLTFDDGWQSQYTDALPILNKHNTKATFYLVSNFLNTNGYLTTKQAEEIKLAGNEIGSHTVDHPDLTTLTPAQLTKELVQSKKTLQALFGPPIRDFASPYGAYNDQVIAAIKLYYKSHRSTDAGYNSKDNFDVYNIRTQTVISTTTVDDINSWIDQAKRDHTWLVLVFHEENKSGDLYSITPKDLNTVLTHIDNVNIPTLTVEQAINQITPQLQ